MSERTQIPIERACRFASIMLERVTLTSPAGETVLADEQAAVRAAIKWAGDLPEGSLQSPDGASALYDACIRAESWLSTVPDSEAIREVIRGAVERCTPQAAPQIATPREEPTQ